MNACSAGVRSWRSSIAASLCDQAFILGLCRWLAIVVEDFEEKHYALPKVTPQEALKAVMQDGGLRHKDIAPIIGNKGLTTEILKGRRNISSALAKRLAAALRVPVELFI